MHLLSSTCSYFFVAIGDSLDGVLVSSQTDGILRNQCSQPFTMIGKLTKFIFFNTFRHK